MVIIQCLPFEHIGSRIYPADSAKTATETNKATISSLQTKLAQSEAKNVMLQTNLSKANDNIAMLLKRYEDMNSTMTAILAEQVMLKKSISDMSLTTTSTTTTTTLPTVCIPAVVVTLLSPPLRYQRIYRAIHRAPRRQMGAMVASTTTLPTAYIP